MWAAVQACNFCSCTAYEQMPVLQPSPSHTLNPPHIAFSELRRTTFALASSPCWTTLQILSISSGPLPKRSCRLPRPHPQ